MCHWCLPGEIHRSTKIRELARSSRKLKRKMNRFISRLSHASKRHFKERVWVRVVGWWELIRTVARNRVTEEQNSRRESDCVRRREENELKGGRACVRRWVWKCRIRIKMKRKEKQMNIRETWFSVCFCCLSMEMNEWNCLFVWLFVCFVCLDCDSFIVGRVELSDSTTRFDANGHWIHCGPSHEVRHTASWHTRRKTHTHTREEKRREGTERNVNEWTDQWTRTSWS